MSIFKAFQKDRKIGTTPFSLNYQNILTANFGGLTPIGSFPVIPKDKFKVGTNILTKVEPMPAPAFTRIKQNQYAFFVPNSQTWKHWNDYVSNGTAYADTYGNNTNNQQTDNLWRPPQISVNQLQLISKIANGWSIPIFSSDVLPYVFYVAVSQYLSETEMEFLYSNLHHDNINAWFQVLLYKMNSLNIIPEWVLTDVPYFNLAIDPDFEFPTEGAWNVRIQKVLLHARFEFGCDMYTASRFINLERAIEGSASFQKLVFVESSITKNEVFNGLDNSTFSYFVCIRSFCDNISNDVSEKHSPFILVKQSAATSDACNRPFTYFVYRKNLYNDIVTDAKTMTSNNLGIEETAYLNRKVRNCGYFWSTDYYSVNRYNDTQSLYRPSYFNNYVFNVKMANPDMSLETFLGIDVDGFMSSDIFLTMRNFKNYLNEVLYDVTRDFTDLEVLPEVGSYASMISDLNDTAHEVTPFTLNTTNSKHNNAQSLYFEDFTFGRVHRNSFDSILPLIVQRSINNPDLIPPSNYWAYTKPLFTFESYNIGFDCWSFLVYQCKSTCKLLDYFNIPLEGLTSRSFDFYVGEYVKAFPFMAYSKIWNDYFRNKVTSSAELDYRETNSVICMDNPATRFMLACYHSGVDSSHFPKWISEQLKDDDFSYNGWCLPFSCAPKNANDKVVLDIPNTDKQIRISDFNHFHDLRVTSWWTALSVLTGWQLQDVTMLQICRYFSLSDENLYGILADKLYLPSYYNGLLHYRYQNFNKDYFSSALLDPMSGANQEEIGATVNSLINAEAKQGFWNRLAQNRSVTQFWQSVFGVTPSHNDYDKPLMLGSAHTDVNVGEVVQLSQTDTTPQGQRSGLGSAHDSSGLFKHTFNEHGYIIILLSHTLELQYMQGLEKDWTPEESFLDLPFIDFVGLGNQSINQKELNFTTKPKLLPSTTSGSQFAAGDTYYYMQEVGYNLLNKINNRFPGSPKLLGSRNMANNSAQTVQSNLANGSGVNLNDVFGYIPRYSTWKFKFDQCHGEFRNDLMFWHSFRKFFTQPILCHEFVNWEFMSENDELMRMFFVTDESTDKFKVDAFINATAVRPLPYVCTPKTSI